MRVSQEPVHVRRRRVVAVGLATVLLVGLATVLLVGGFGFASRFGGEDLTEGGATAAGPQEAKNPAGAGEDTASGEEDTSSGEDEGTDGEDEGTDGEDESEEGDEGTGPDWQRQPAPAEHPSDTTAMEQLHYLQEGTPKSVVSSGHGLLLTSNMMYSHTASVLDAETREVITRLDDGLDLAEFGIEGHPGVSRGSPVEAVWTQDGRYAYVSQYTMYGENFGVEGFDDCTKDSGVGGSLVYRFDADEMAWDQVIEVGAVPKYLALTPDQSTLLVSNWCDYTVSLVDTESGQETSTLDVGRNPRGIVTFPDNRTALVTAMWNEQVWRLDLQEGTSEVVMETPSGPRHLNLTEDGSTAYLTVARANLIYKLDAQTMEILDQVEPGAEPRSMVMSPDESALYVVNYDEATVSKIRTSDMTVIQKVDVDGLPIGIDYDPVTNTVWVACYGGGIYVFEDQGTLL